MQLGSTNKHKFNLLYKQDIFQSILSRINAKHNGCTVIVPHVCNNANIFDGGFAAHVNQHYPSVKTNFNLLGKAAKLGHTQFVTTHKHPEYGYEIIFANMISQNNIRTKKQQRPLNYIALAYCMNQVRSYAHNYVKNNEQVRIELHCPKFGSGLAGGDWKFIADMIDDAWQDIKNIYIYSL